MRNKHPYVMLSGKQTIGTAALAIIFLQEAHKYLKEGCYDIDLLVYTN